METLYFVLGMLSVVTLLAVGGMVMTANKTRKLTQELDILKTLIGNENDELNRELAKLEHHIGTALDEAEKRIDKKEDELIRYADQLHSKHEDDLNDLYRYVDSRTDKMADGFSKHIADINARFNDNTAFVDTLSHRVDNLEK